jgi:hypothetical protein
MGKATKAEPPSDDSRSHVLSIRLKFQQLSRLQRFARQLGRTASEAGALLVEEGLRRSEFACVDFRSTLTGRNAYITGTRLAVWQVISLSRDYSGDIKKVATHLEWSESLVQAAFNYAAAFPEEINHAIADNDSYDFETISRLLPQSNLHVAEATSESNPIRKRKSNSGKTRK